MGSDGRPVLCCNRICLDNHNGPCALGACRSNHHACHTKDKNHADPAAKMTKPVMASCEGAHGEVWANTGAKTYHCEDAHSCATTKAGEYMTETSAKAKAYKAASCKAGSK